MIADHKSPFRLTLPLLKRSDYEGEGTYLNMAALFDDATELTSSRAAHNLLMLAHEVDGFLQAASGIDLHDAASREDLATAMSIMHSVQLRLQCWADQALDQHEQACAQDRKEKLERQKILEMRRRNESAA